jgi:hypothetical protein
MALPPAIDHELTAEEFRVLITLVDNAWRMADEYRAGREPGTEAETKALVYQLTIERIQSALKGA